MFINSITPIADISELSQSNKVQSNNNNSNMFADVFNNALTDVVQTSKKVEQNAYDLAVGNTDNLHDMQIDLAKAQMSLQFMVQLRNKAMESYSEIMRINL